MQRSPNSRKGFLRMGKDSNILVVPTAEATRLVKQPQNLLSTTSGAHALQRKGYAPGSPEILCNLLSVGEFKHRPQMEEDPSYKQLIPYILVRLGRFTGQMRYLTYVRSRMIGEERLIGKASLGVGGHVDESDKQAVFARMDLRKPAMREVTEELHIPDLGARLANGDASLDLLGFVNDNTDEVGAVHLGVVYELSLLPLGTEDGIVPNDNEMTDLQFRLPQDIVDGEFFDKLEGWSQICARDVLLRRSALGRPMTRPVG